MYLLKIAEVATAEERASETLYDSHGERALTSERMRSNWVDQFLRRTVTPSLHQAGDREFIAASRRVR
jgi:hypothetical protein